MKMLYSLKLKQNQKKKMLIPRKTITPTKTIKKLNMNQKKYKQLKTSK